ncbi:SRPBCC domain-containing protein [Streptomyces sp. RFCAC02]|uniref:SRPBCC domain-containing protein n=1 Tax=Streptomyces sp. RFCAC02 TaxID=2499143 RepID=UPI001F110FD2|nr:SRPBCC domain-containing protein [Streptomyces sp. RFCAC02]
MAMEHEVYVPLSATVVRRAFADPERVSRCVPGLQAEPDGTSAGLRGRLRVRVGSSTITYRGTLVVTERGEGVVVECEGEEARGSGTARLVLTVVPRPVADGSGTTLAFGGQVEATGRLAEAGADRLDAAGRRLLDRFAEALAADLAADGGERDAGADGEFAVRPVPGGIGTPDDNERAIPGIPAASEPEPDPFAPEGLGLDELTPAERDAAEAAGERVDDLADLAGTGEAGGRPGAEDARGGPDDPGDADDPAGIEEVSLLGGTDAVDELTADELLAGDEDLMGAEDIGDLVDLAAEEGVLSGGGEVPEPEADFARRTMIGRSAEEVDHAPPRGRYAPEPAPGRTPGPSAVLRWAAPAAAVAVAGAVLIRVLRRRHPAGR